MLDFRVINLAIRCRDRLARRPLLLQQLDEIKHMVGCKLRKGASTSVKLLQYVFNTRTYHKLRMLVVPHGGRSRDPNVEELQVRPERDGGGTCCPHNHVITVAAAN